MPEVFKTGIAVLDNLMGIPEEGVQFSNETDTVLIIRGKPGSGKTTLALQILDSMLNIAVENKESCKAVFYSIETDAIQTLEKMFDQYRFFKKFTVTKEVNGEKKIEIDDNVIARVNGGDIKSMINSNFDNYKKAAKKFLELIPHGELIQMAIDLFNFEGRSPLLKTIDKNCLEPENIHIVVIDSINALVLLLSTFVNAPPRLILSKVCDELKKKFKNSLIILTSESHNEQPDFMKSLSESYYSDIEISLNKELVRGLSDSTSILNPL